MNLSTSYLRWHLPNFTSYCTKWIIFLCFLISNQTAIFANPDPAWCSLPPDYSISAGQTRKISVLVPGSTISNGKVFFLGNGATLEVDKTFIFSNCFFICGAGAKINIITNSNLSPTKCFSFSSKYFSCSTLWEGITVMPGNTIDFRGNQLYDAAKAINFPPQYNNITNRLTNNVFENNIYGLYVGLRPSQFNASVGFLFCYGNSFSGTSTLKNGDAYPEAGAFVTQNSSLLFGTSGGGKNTFKNMLYGIMVIRLSFADIANSDFINMVDEGIVSGTNAPNDGTGVYINGSSAVVTQTGNARCLFEENAFAGVYVTEARGRVLVERSDFKGAQPYGIRYDKTVFNTYLTFSENVFDLNEFECISAIQVIRPPASNLIPNSAINDNTINYPQMNFLFVPPPLESFIKVDGVVGANNQFFINDNIINNNSKHKSAHGIYISGLGDNYNILDNQLYYLAPESDLSSGHSCLGIVFDALPGEGNSIFSNGVVSRLRTTSNLADTDDKSYVKCGIHVDNCNRPNIRCNILENTFRGIHFSGINLGTDFAENIMNHHVFGAEFRKNTTGGASTNIEDQEWKLNLWIDNTAAYVNGGKAARYFDNITATPFVFRVNPNLAPPNIYDFFPPNALPFVPVWFKSEIGTGQPVCGFPTFEPPIWQYTDSEILISKGQYQHLSAAEEWDAQRQLWYNITRHPSEVNQNTDIQSFSSNTWGSSAQRFANAMYQYEQALIPNATTAGQLAGYYQQESALELDIRSILALIAQDTVNIDPAVLLSLEGKWAALLSAQGDIQTTMANFENTQWLNIQNLITQVTALPASQIWEKGWKSILQAGIKWIQSDTFTVAERTSLIDIAMACGADIGLARSSVLPFMPIEDAYPFLGRESDEDCWQPAEERFDNVAHITNMKVFPNPAKNILNISLPSHQSGILEVFDILGRLVQSQAVDSQEVITMNLQKILPGTYWIQFTTSEQSASRAMFLKVNH